jgi:hypothetical protein
VEVRVFGTPDIYQLLFSLHEFFKTRGIWMRRIQGFLDIIRGKQKNPPCFVWASYAPYM